MEKISFIIASLVGISIGVLTMSILFAVSTAKLNVWFYIGSGLFIGTFGGLSVYWLINRVE